MDLHDLKAHVDARFDKLDDKMDGIANLTTKHDQQLLHLQGFAKLVISILLAASGFFALAYFNLKGP